jgi:hypothetical protein
MSQKQVFSKSWRNFLWRSTRNVMGGTVILSLGLLSSGCAPVVETFKSAVMGEEFPELPTPEIATYVVDLSGSTYPFQQLTALGSGIEQFVSGESLGQPFHKPQIAPKSLSIQFITENSANAPRITLVSAKTGLDLYAWVEERTPNLDQAKPLWQGLVSARTRLATERIISIEDCTQKAITYFGAQGLSREVLSEPARVICADIQRTNASLDQLREFVANPGVPLGSDIFGALELAVANLKRAEVQFPFSRKTLVFASDMIDSSSQRGFNRSLKAVSDLGAACEMANRDLAETYGGSLPFQDLTVVLVGQGNSRANVDLIGKVRKYWSCYLTSAGAELIETSDLNNY